MPSRIGIDEIIGSSKANTDVRFLVFQILLVGTHHELDLPLNFHPAAIRASAKVTPFGAVSVPA
jgi:hypothetical protein